MSTLNRMSELFINPAYCRLEPSVRQALLGFDHMGALVYDKRNQVRIMDIGGIKVAVKRFRRRPFIVSLFRKSKAAKAYDVAQRLVGEGIGTPDPIACQSGRFSSSSEFFLSVAVDAVSAAELLRHRDFDRDLAAELARFIRSLHVKGIWHKDLNLSNILVDNALSYPEKFILIDNNRTAFTKPSQSPSLNKVVANLMRVTHRRDLQKCLLENYAAISGISSRELTISVIRKLLAFERSKTIRHHIKRDILHLKK